MKYLSNFTMPQKAASQINILFSIMLTLKLACASIIKYQLFGFIGTIMTIFYCQAIYADEHEHQKISTTKSYSVSYPIITLTDITITNTRNKRISFINELDKGPVIINFIFTSCTAICPILSSTFSQVQKRFGEIKVKNINLISFSIDPERDTPSKLKEYAKKFNAGKRWNFFTGSKTEMRQIENMFGNYRGNKMNHLPYTFIRINKNSPWIRLKGFVSASAIKDEINNASSN